MCHSYTRIKDPRQVRGLVSLSQKELTEEVNSPVVRKSLTRADLTPFRDPSYSCFELQNKEKPFPDNNTQLDTEGFSTQLQDWESWTLEYIFTVDTSTLVQFYDSMT